MFLSVFFAKDISHFIIKTDPDLWVVSKILQMFDKIKF